MFLLKKGVAFSGCLVSFVLCVLVVRRLGGGMFMCVCCDCASSLFHVHVGWLPFACLLFLCLFNSVFWSRSVRPSVDFFLQFLLACLIFFTPLHFALPLIISSFFPFEPQQDEL